jgi:hypothetical protein
VTVGQKDLSVQSGTNDCDGPSCYWGTPFNVALADPSAYLTVPADGTITGWRVRGLVAGAGVLRLHAMKPLGGVQYLGVGDTIAASSVNGTAVNPASLAVHAADALSVSTESFNLAGAKSHLGYVNSPGASYSSVTLLSAGNTGNAYDPPSTGRTFLYNADVDLALPRIDSVDVSRGPIGGGTAVTVTGDHLSIVTAVKFGDASAVITAASNTSISAVSPASASGGIVDLSVSTAGGTAAKQFTYDDLKPPTVSKFKLSRSKFSVANIGGPVIARVGTTVKFDLSEDADVSFSVSRVGKKGHLKALSKKQRWVVTGKLGANKFTFSGRPGKRPLAAGKYVLTASPVDIVGTLGKTVRAAFRIVK